MRNYIGHFSLWGDFEPDEITKALSLQPSIIYPKGHTFEGADHPAKIATWDFHCPPELSAMEQINFLLNLLRPAAESLRRLSERYTAAFNVCCEEESVFSLSAEQLQELATLHVQLNCFFHEDEAEDAHVLSPPPNPA